MMTVFNRDLSRAVDILGDMLTNSLYRSADVENERSTIYRELIETQKSGPMETTIEIAHRGAYGSHQMGLPILGHIHNMRTISRDMIVEYHDKNYVGENIIVVGCGPIDHDQLVDDVQKYLKVGKSKAAPNSAVNFAKPAFQYGVTALESDLTENINVAAIVEAPSYFDTRFFSYLLLQRIIGDKP
jgi:predicted Zn-dependent peptidase